MRAQIKTVAAAISAWLIGLLSAMVLWNLLPSFMFSF